jgi:hypothetical protein
MFGRYWKVAPFHFGYHPHPLSKFLSNKILNPLRSKPVRKLQQKNIVPLLIEVELVIAVFEVMVIGKPFEQRSLTIKLVHLDYASRKGLHKY